MRRYARKDPIVRELAGFALFAGLTDRELARVAARGERLRSRAGELIMLERFRGEQLLLILEGEVAVSLEGEEIATLTRGDVVGEIGLLRRTDRMATVVARTDVRFLALDGEAFASLLAEIPELRPRLEELMRERLADHAP